VSPGQTITNFSWNFGDGSPIVSSTQRTVSHTYTSAATFTVSLVVTDSNGRTASRTAAVTVGTGNPVASFTASPTTPAHSMTFDGSASVAVGTSTITSYQWAFGDGNFGGPSASPSITYTYAGAGTFTVTLTVTDNLGRTGVTSQSVTVP
jgi:PKD repeat protein